MILITNTVHLIQRSEVTHQQQNATGNLQKPETNEESSVFDSADLSSADFELRSLPAGNYSTGSVNSDAIAR